MNKKLFFIMISWGCNNSIDHILLIRNNRIVHQILDFVSLNLQTESNTLSMNIQLKVIMLDFERSMMTIMQVMNGAMLNSTGQSTKVCTAAGPGPLTIALVWHDYPGSTNAAIAASDSGVVAIPAAAVYDAIAAVLPVAASEFLGSTTAGTVVSVLAANVAVTGGSCL